MPSVATDSRPGVATESAAVLHPGVAKESAVVLHPGVTIELFAVLHPGVAAVLHPGVATDSATARRPDVTTTELLRLLEADRHPGGRVVVTAEQCYRPGRAGDGPVTLNTYDI